MRSRRLACRKCWRFLVRIAGCERCQSRQATTTATTTTTTTTTASATDSRMTTDYYDDSRAQQRRHDNPTETCTTTTTTTPESATTSATTEGTCNNDYDDSRANNATTTTTTTEVRATADYINSFYNDMTTTTSEETSADSNDHYDSNSRGPLADTTKPGNPDDSGTTTSGRSQTFLPKQIPTVAMNCHLDRSCYPYQKAIILKPGFLITNRFALPGSYKKDRIPLDRSFLMLNPQFWYSHTLLSLLLSFKYSFLNDRVSNNNE